ncbi:IclR family transcriptional regulator [Roseinatronobacter thiooxidans]|uniref:IclR family transcriptional regulator n=1 Tax=Roseinatronobacter thiooxidans TaxID=121821 RepID=A0A2W7Q0G5_9RHOB|nr:IclR family transcriptional regulator [Roseinatronobacter thiooxidans]PZX42054.1 IclR family transcriptional regulator [Roseinatronobacter thiooxidans]
MAAAPRNPVERALQMINLMGASGDPDRIWGVRELAVALDIPPSAAHRTLASLVNASWLKRDESGRGYCLGLELIRLSFLISGNHPLRRIAKPVMEDLVAECDETVLLGVLNPENLRMIFALSVESQNPLRYVVELNRWIPIHYSASGLGIMAFLPEAQREEVLSRADLERAHEETVTAPDLIRAEINKIRRQGYAISFGQRLQDAVGIAAPIFGPEREVIGDLCITLPKQRFNGTQDEARLSATVIKHATRISQILAQGSGDTHDH